MAKQSQPMRTKETPLGGFFCLGGLIAGYIYAMAISGLFWPSVIFGLLCAGVGYVIEPIIYRIIIIALFLLMAIARQAIFGATLCVR